MPETQPEKNLVYVSNVQMAMTEEEAILVFYSGRQVHQFIFSPKHIKRLDLFLQKNISAWEKKYGNIVTKLIREKKDTREREAIGFQ